MAKTSQSDTDRRGFLKLAGTAAPAAIVAVAAGTTAAEASPVDPTAETMQDTAHTRAYFESTRF